jgi:hypothetical protein
MKTLAYIIRIITVPPILAFVMLFGIYINKSDFFGGIAGFVLSILFLVIFPLLAYPLQPLLKSYKDKGREGQRSLAIIFAVIGYILGFFTAIFLAAPQNVSIIFLSYLLCGFLIMVSTKVFHFKASGHTCGIVGPFLLLVYFGQVWGYGGIGLLVLGWISSIYMKRHTHLQLAAGAMIPFLALAIIILIMSLLH